MSAIPVLIFDWKELPYIADSIWNAQMAGWERILTYRGPLPRNESSGIRRQTMKYEVESIGYRIPTGLDVDRDEYPFACTLEGSSRDGSRQCWVRSVPRIENQKQGGRLRAFLLEKNISAFPPNNRFEVRVINHPRGPIVR